MSDNSSGTLKVLLPVDPSTWTVPALNAPLNQWLVGSLQIIEDWLVQGRLQNLTPVMLRDMPAYLATIVIEWMDGVLSAQGVSFDPNDDTYDVLVNRFFAHIGSYVAPIG